MSEPTPPSRRLTLVLNLHADDLDEIGFVLTRLAHELPAGPTDRAITSGGSASGWHLVLTDAGVDVTHGTYIEALNTYLEERRAGAERTGGGA